MRYRSLVIACLLVVSRALPAQQQKPAMVAEDGGLQERGSARVLYWNPRADTALGQFAIEYGRPAWKKEYDDSAKFDGLTNGKIWRLGSNFWTVLDTSLPLKIAGRAVPVGSYYLGLRRSADGGTWSLAFIDPAKVRKARLDAFQIERAPVEFEMPMTMERGAGTSEKLTITLSYTKENPKSVTLKIGWGKLSLRAPIEVTVGS